MTAPNTKPKDAKALQQQASKEDEPNFEDMEFTASTEVRELPEEMKQAAPGAAAPQNVVPMNKAAAPGQAAQVARPAGTAMPQPGLPANVIELQTKMKMMEVQHAAQMKLVEGKITEILINIKQKSASIDQDIMRIKAILDQINPKK